MLNHQSYFPIPIGILLSTFMKKINGKPNGIKDFLLVFKKPSTCMVKVILQHDY